MAYMISKNKLSGQREKRFENQLREQLDLGIFDEKLR